MVTIKKFALKTILFSHDRRTSIQTLRAQCIITRLFKYLIYSQKISTEYCQDRKVFIRYFINTTLTINNDS